MFFFSVLIKYGIIEHLETLYKSKFLTFCSIIPFTLINNASLQQEVLVQYGGAQSSVRFARVSWFRYCTVVDMQRSTELVRGWRGVELVRPEKVKSG